MKQENGRYAAGFLFAVATFVVMAIWLCTQYTPQRLWELFAACVCAGLPEPQG